jgi:hypothetical protein
MISTTATTTLAADRRARLTRRANIRRLTAEVRSSGDVASGPSEDCGAVVRPRWFALRVRRAVVGG